MINLSKWWEAKEPEYAQAIKDAHDLAIDLEYMAIHAEEILLRVRAIRASAEQRMPTDTGVLAR